MADGTPKRIQRRRTKGWQLPPGAVCVDRSTGFGNPFPLSKSTDNGEETWIVGTWGGPAMWVHPMTKAEAADLAVQAYRAWIADPRQETLRRKAVLALRGHDLACSCPLVDKNGERVPCHADVLLEIANNSEVRADEDSAGEMRAMGESK